MAWGMVLHGQNFWFHSEREMQMNDSRSSHKDQCTPMYGVSYKNDPFGTLQTSGSYTRRSYLGVPVTNSVTLYAAWAQDQLPGI